MCIRDRGYSVSYNPSNDVVQKLQKFNLMCGTIRRTLKSCLLYTSALTLLDPTPSSIRPEVPVAFITHAVVTHIHTYTHALALATPRLVSSSLPVSKHHDLHRRYFLCLSICKKTKSMYTVVTIYSTHDKIKLLIIMSPVFLFLLLFIFTLLFHFISSCSFQMLLQSRILSIYPINNFIND